MSLIQFFSFDSLYEYIAQITSRPLYGTEEAYDMWYQQFEATMRNQVKVIPKADGSFEYWYETGESDVVLSDVGQMYNTTSASASSSSASQAVGGGGVKSAPTVSTVITEAVNDGIDITKPSAGMKDVGLDIPNSIGNILGGAMKAFGLISLAVTLSNVHSWVDLLNYVFGANLPQDATVDDVKAFMHNRWHTIIGGQFDGSADPTTYVPDGIMTRLYDYLAQHMDEDGTIEGFEFDGYPILTGYNNLRYTPVSRYWILAEIPAVPHNRTMRLHHTYFGENLLHNWIIDGCSQLIGMGFNVSQSTTDVLLSQTNGITEYVREHRSVAIGYKYVRIEFALNRSAGVPLSQPISPSEIQIVLQFSDDTKMVIDSGSVTELCSYVPDASTADAWRFSKYGRLGNDDGDFGYRTVSDYYYESGTDLDRYTLIFGFSANEFTVISDDHTPLHFNADTSFVHFTNGYAINGLDTDQNLPINPTLPQQYLFEYSNLGYNGQIKNYKPDTDLKKIAVKDGNSKTPSPDKTKENRYVGWLDPVKHLKVGQIDSNRNNTVTHYVPVTIPNGKETAQQIADYGYGTSDLPTTDPNYNPNGYSDPGSQQDRQTGKIPSYRPIEDVNEDINDAIDDYNNSRTTPKSTPDPIPETEPNPQYPTNPPTDTSGDTGDTPTPGTMTGVTASGMCSVYNPTKQELINFSAWLWSPNFLDNFLKIFANPMDAIIGLHIMYATPITTTPSNIICGYLDSGVSAKVVNQQFSYIDCGTVQVPEYYGNAIDYEPYTQMHCYLPFIGIVSLKPNDVIGKQLNIKYGVDAMTGTCLAILTTKKGDSDIVKYTFAGNCATQIPVSGGSYAQMITGLAGVAASAVAGVATGNPIALLGAGASILNTHLDVAHSGSIGANAGAMGIRKPYLIITRKSAYDAANYSNYYGLPANKTLVLGTCKGFTRVKSVHVEIPLATANEKKEIETLLKQGIIIN